MSASPRLALPFLVPGQAQKEVYHNEALQLLDMLVAAAVEEGPRRSPPAGPPRGTCYLVGEDPEGLWVGQEHCLACFTGGGWRFVQPVEGMTVFLRREQNWAVYGRAGWEIGFVRGSTLVIDGEQVVGPRAGAIGSPEGGNVIDREAREAIDGILSALRQHGLVEV